MDPDRTPPATRSVRPRLARPVGGDAVLRQPREFGRESSPAARGRRPAPLRMLWITAALGACFLAVRWGLRDAPLLWFAALRALLAGAALGLVAHVQRRPLPRSPAVWGRLVALGLVNVSVAFWAMFAGIAGLATGVAAVLANAQPLLIIVPAWLICRERVSARTVAALVVGFGGLLVVATQGGSGRGVVLSLLAALAVTAGTLMARHLGPVDVVVASAVHFLFGGVMLAAVAVWVEGEPAITWTPRFVAVLAFLGLIATAATTLAWFVESRRCPLSALTPCTFLIPVFGVLIGVVVLGERPGLATVTGIVLVLLSMRVALGRQDLAGATPGRLHIADPTGPSTTTRRPR